MTLMMWAGWFVAIVLGTGIWCLARRVRRNDARIAELEATQAEVIDAAEVIAHTLRRERGRHLRGLVVVPAVWAARQVVRPQVAAGLASIALASGAVMDANRGTGTADRPADGRVPSELQPRTPTERPAGPAMEPAAATSPTAEVPAGVVGADATPRRTPAPPTGPTTTTTVPATTTTTVDPPALLADPNGNDCVIGLGGLGIPVGVLCSPGPGQHVEEGAAGGVGDMGPASDPGLEIIGSG